MTFIQVVLAVISIGWVAVIVVIRSLLYLIIIQGLVSKRLFSFPNIKEVGSMVIMVRTPLPILAIRPSCFGSLTISSILVSIPSLFSRLMELGLYLDNTILNP